MEDVCEFYCCFFGVNDVMVVVVGVLFDKLFGVLEELIGCWKKFGVLVFECYVLYYFDEYVECFVSYVLVDVLVGSVVLVVIVVLY